MDTGVPFHFHFSERSASRNGTMEMSDVTAPGHELESPHSSRELLFITK